jgi:AraC-like DNA-binding protein
MIANPLPGPGSFSVLQFPPELVAQWLAEQQPTSFRGAWGSQLMKPISQHLRQHLTRFFELFEPATCAMQVQSELTELSEGLISELIPGARHAGPVAGHQTRAALRMRECLTEEGLHLDLETLARHAGLSRFEAVRAFKKRYGLPPHAYQLCLRMSHARRLLLEGAAPADVAQRCSFADQSHFNRHFKRFHGVTPMQYARAHTLATRSTLGMRGRLGDPNTALQRSDR